MKKDDKWVSKREQQDNPQDGLQDVKFLNKTNLKLFNNY